MAIVYRHWDHTIVQPLETEKQTTPSWWVNKYVKTTAIREIPVLGICLLCFCWLSSIFTLGPAESTVSIDYKKDLLLSPRLHVTEEANSYYVTESSFEESFRNIKFLLYGISRQAVESH